MLSSSELLLISMFRAQSPWSTRSSRYQKDQYSRLATVCVTESGVRCEAGGVVIDLIFRYYDFCLLSF